MIFEERPRKVHLFVDHHGLRIPYSGRPYTNSLCRGNWDNRGTLFTDDPSEVTCRICLSKMGRYKKKNFRQEYTPINVTWSVTAVRHEIGVVVHTRHGEVVGNGIIYGVEESRHTGETLYLVETDFGNKSKYTESELHNRYKLALPVNYNKWKKDRMELVNRQEEPK